MQRTNKYWELYRKYGDRSRRTANSKHANTCALEYSHSTHNIPESTVCVQRVLREYREFSSNAKNIVIISVDEKQPKKNTHETKAKRQQKKTYTQHKQQYHQKAPMLKPSKQVREFTAMQFRQSKSYKLLHKFLLKTSSVR